MVVYVLVRVCMRVRTRIGMHVCVMLPGECLCRYDWAHIVGYMCASVIMWSAVLSWYVCLHQVSVVV